MIRRTITLLLCALAFWGGMSFERLRIEQSCRSLGGQPAVGGRLCLGAQP